MSDLASLVLAVAAAAFNAVTSLFAYRFNPPAGRRPDEPGERSARS